MADILLTVGVDTSLSYAEFQAGITSLVAQVNANPPKIKLKFDDSSLSSMRKQIESMTKAAASAGSLTKLNGYTQTNSGIWHGQETWSRTVIPGAHFVDDAVSSFMGNYASEYNVIDISIGDAFS